MASMRYWLMKSEPETFGIDHLLKKKREFWDGVRNYQARNMMRDQMRAGDLAFFYHSNCEVPGIYGLMKVVKAGYPDRSALNPDSKYYDPKASDAEPRWYGVDVEFVEKFKRPITLAQLRSLKGLEDFQLLAKGNRLSILPVAEKYYKLITESVAN